MYVIVFSDRFKKDLQKLIKKDFGIKNKIRKQIELLVVNPRHKSLRTHKLSGTDNWSLSINMSLRLIFTIRKNIILCTRIGTHDEVY
jgi:addiction module RelE/StbE family toxin